MDLTPRQRAIGELVARGLTDREIAREAGISIQTARTHVRDAAARIPGEGRARFKLLLWFFTVADES